MKVFALMKQYCNGCESWENVESLFFKEIDAAEAQIKLEDANANADNGLSWYICEMEVK